jgi:hypothetical protein
LWIELNMQTSIEDHQLVGDQGQHSGPAVSISFLYS